VVSSSLVTGAAHCQDRFSDSKLLESEQRCCIDVAAFTDWDRMIKPLLRCGSLCTAMSGAGSSRHMHPINESQMASKAHAQAFAHPK
jgi:hypothetical protein